MIGAPFPCKGERVMTADERSPKPRFFCSQQKQHLLWSIVLNDKKEDNGMMNYVGISMVIVICTLCVAVLSRLVTASILDEIEKMRSKRTARQIHAVTMVAESFGKMISGIVSEAEKYKSDEKKENKEE